MYPSSPSRAWTSVISSYLYVYIYIYTHTWIYLSSSSCAWTVVISSNLACSSPSSCSVWLIHVSAKTHDAFIHAPSFMTYPHECHDSCMYHQVLLAEFLFCMTHLRKCHDSWPIHTRAIIHEVFTQISWLMVHHYVSHGIHMCLPWWVSAMMPWWVMRYPLVCPLHEGVHMFMPWLIARDLEFALHMCTHDSWLVYVRVHVCMW